MGKLGINGMEKYIHPADLLIFFKLKTLLELQRQFLPSQHSGEINLLIMKKSIIYTKV